VAVEAISREKTLSQLRALFQVHPVQIAQWRKAALKQLQESMVLTTPAAPVSALRRAAAGWVICKATPVRRPAPHVPGQPVEKNRLARILLSFKRLNFRIAALGLVPAPKSV